MALFQTPEVTENDTIKFNKISQDFDNELKQIYSQRDKEYKQAQERQSVWVNNLVSKDKIDEWNSQGAMGALDVWNKKKKYELLPYVGTIAQGNEAFSLKKTADKLKQGLNISPEEKKAFEDFVLDMAEMQTRGYTFMGGATNLGLETLPFLAEFGVGLLTTGGAGALGATAAKIGAKKAIKEAVGDTVKKATEEIAKDGILKAAAKGTGKLLYDATINPKTLAFTASRLPQQVYAQWGDIRLSDSLYLSPEGHVILNEAEQNPATAFMKALALTNIEVASEASGAKIINPALNRLRGFIAPKVLSKLPKGFSEKFIELAEKTTKLPFFKAVDSLGFNGLVEEIGEERIADLLKVTFNLDEQEGYSFKQFVDAAFVSPKQLAQEALAFGAIGGVASLADKGLRKASKKYSADEFLCDSGIFRTIGSISLIDRKAKAVLKEQGKTDEEIDSAIRFGSREQKVQFLRDNNAQITSEEEIEEGKELLAKKIREANPQMNEDMVQKSAQVYAQGIANLADKTNITIDEAIEKYAPNFVLSNKPVFVDDNNNQYGVEEINQRLIDVQNELTNLPSDFNDENYVNQLMSDIQILEDMANGKLDEKNEQRAFELLNRGANNTQVENLTQIDVRGTFDAQNPNIYYQNINPIEIEKDAVPEFEKISQLKKWIEEELNLLGDVQIKENNKIVQFSKSNISRSLKGVSRNKVKKQSYSKLRELVENAIFTTNKEVDDRHKERNKGQEIYHNAFIYDGKVYGIEIAFDIPKSDNSLGSYAGHKIKIIKAPEVNEVSSEEGLLDLTGANISINDIRGVFNPNIKQHEEKFYQGEAEQINIFPGNREAKKIHKVKGGYIPADKFVEYFKGADESTIIHECAHWYLDRLVELAQYNEEIAQDLEAVRSYLKNNGEEFTRAQHEKFARGFEAYILTGSAKNNKIKKMFNDFRNWLLNIYDDIRQLGFKNEDMPELINLFDKLMTSERVQSKATFDKIQKIEEQIEQIRDNQETELDELDELYKTNIEANNRESDKNRKVEEYLELASKASKKEPKEVKEFRERYKEATLQILEVATGMTRQQIAHPKNAQKVEEAINDVADKITISGGLRPEWQEFYADTGVNYDTDEVGGDYELALQAWQVYQDGTYKIDDSEYSDIEEFAGKFDYLYGKVLSLKGEERYVALEALYELFGNMPALPNDYTQELVDRLQKLEEDTQEDEKETFNRKRYANVPVTQLLQRKITDKLQSLKIYNPETKYRMRLDKSHRLYRYIKEAVSVNRAKEIIRKINNFVIEDLRNQQRAIIHKGIQKEVRINSKLVGSGASKKGKFDWRTNTVFAELKELNKLTKAEALAKYEELARLGEIVKSQSREGWDENNLEFNDFKNEFEEILKRNFIEYKSQTGRLNENAKGYRVSTLNIQLGVKVLEDIIKLKKLGREAKDKAELDKKLNKRNYRNDLVQRIKQFGQGKFNQKFVKHLLYSGETLPNWETLLNALFGADVAKDFSLLNDEADVEIYRRNVTLKLFRRIAKVYNLKNASAFDKFLDWDNAQAIIDLFQGFEKEKFTVRETTFDINTGDFLKSNVELTKGQLITLYAWSLNENLKQRLYTQYGAEQLENLFLTRLNDNDKSCAWAMVDTLQEMYPDINEVFINETGLSLPQEENYIPSNPERIISEVDMLHDTIAASKTPSSTKARKNCKRIKMNPIPTLELVLPHTEKMSRYVVMQEKLNFYNAIFANANITAALREMYGKKDGEALHRLIKNQLAEISLSGRTKANGKLKEYADNLSKNYIVGNIAGSLKVALGQLTSMINFAEKMPVASWGFGFAKALANPVENFKYMMENSQYLQTRLAGNTQNEIIASLTNEGDKFRKLTNFFTSNVRWGDIIAVTLGGRAYVDYLIDKKGMSKEEAFREFEAEVMRAQQASTASSTSQWQKHQARNAWGRAFWAFRTTEFQFERKVYDAILKAHRGEISKGEMVKTIMIYRVVNPIMFSVMLQQIAIAPLLRMLFGDDDDPTETLKELGISGLVALMTANLCHWGYAGLISGFGIQSVIKYLSKDSGRKVFKTKVPIISEVEDVTASIFKKGGPETKDWVEAIALGVQYGTGLPAQKAVNMGYGVTDVIKGNAGVGLLRIAGWGEYPATEALTGEAPKKKKRKNAKNK